MKCLAALLLATLSYAQTADSLRTNLTYLASDELEGRGTPSKGLDLAADYIAAQFKAAGLTPVFQTAHFAEAKPNLDGFALTLNATVIVTADQVSIRSLVGEDLSNQKISAKPSNGKIFATDSRTFQTENHPALVLVIGPDRKGPPRSPAPFLDDTESPRPPTIVISSTAALDLFKAGKLKTITLHLAKPEVTPATLRNVTAILPGSDPKLSHQYVILGAHYDHLGRSEKGIFNGANDDGSGTVSVIEVAKALAAAPTHPKRSILFITFFGEEKGLLGSFYYAAHPLVPTKDTIAAVCLEQMGRTDDNAGPQVSSMAFTGPKYTDIPAIMEEAAKPEGIKTYTRPDANDFFARSDNYPFAKKHIPDTTIAVAFEYPEYHAIGDTVDKIDFENMAKVDRGVAAGITALADGKPPKFTALIP